MMLTQERRQQIMEAIERGGTVSAQTLADRFGVSTMTIRRDLQFLETDGLARRVHGGAITLRGRGYEPAFFHRQGQESEEKGRIGKRAAELVSEGDTLVLDVGTTVLELAHCLHRQANLTVLVTGLHAANELAGRPNIHLIVAAGVVRYPELSLSGSLTERILNEFYFDKAFIGASGMSMQGITGFNLEDALVKSVLVQRARQRILLVDHTKFNTVAFKLVAPLSSINTIVTGFEADAGAVEQMREHGVDVILT
ncbi:MAG: DeoR/GlpR family DNA-binding transcription regulator [Chloroflexota bacterium]|nr:MAG: DeoR/GlpR transcriptional regulator [Chloroflexota bacterium]